MRSDSARWIVASLALAFYAIHATRHLLHGHPEHLLWACHLAVLLVALAFLLDSPTPNGIALCWLVAGDPLWLLDLAGGAEFYPTSLCTHVGGLVLALVGLRRFGMPANVWWKAAALFAALQIVSYAVTPAAANVNAAFRFWAGWPGRALVCAAMLAAFFAIERVAQRATAATA